MKLWVSAENAGVFKAESMLIRISSPAPIKPTALMVGSCKVTFYPLATHVRLVQDTYEPCKPHALRLP